jgi:hypothetical protein
MDQKLKYILILAFVLNSAFLLSNFQDRTYDSYEHVFFADHYRSSWFDTWESKWYGGFAVTSYPPLAHQSIALVSFVIGLDWSFKGLTLLLMTIFPMAIYEFSKVFVREKAAIYAAFVSVLIPSVLQAIYSFGQFPTLFGLVAGLFTIVYLSKFLINGSWFNLAIALSLLGVSVSAHHFTAVFLVPALVVVLFLNILLRRKEISMAVSFRRILLFSLIGIVLCLVIIYPYWEFMFFSGIKMAPIPHLSRANILFDVLGFELFFWNMYSSILFLIPLFFILAFRDRRLFPLLAGALFLFVLGLGGTTPLPQLLFGQSWETLTYDRFSLWAGVMLLPFSGLLFVEFQDKFNAKKYYKIVLSLFFAILILTSAYAANRSLNIHGGISISNIDPVIEFLNAPVVQNWRYLTLGLGEPAMLKLSVYASAKNIDGYYFFVRSDPLLAKSGIGTLDTARYFGENGMAVLGEVLSNSSKYSLRWIICAEPSYYQILLENGFTERWSQDITGDFRFGGITIWEYNGAIPEYVPISHEENRLNDYLWGTGPPLILLIAILLLIVKKVKKIRS